VNLLRGATEAFSAIVGGCDSLSIRPFDHGSTRPDDFSLRLARSQQLILNHEAHLGAVIDPAGGSYYVEKLTSSLAEQAWEKFVEIEEVGGMMQQLQSGRMAEWIGARIAGSSERIARRHDIVVGVNKYLNLSEKTAKKEDVSYEAIHNLRVDEIAKLKKRAANKIDTDDLTALHDCWQERPAEAIHKMIDLADRGVTFGELTKALRADQPHSARILPLTPFRSAEMFEKLRQSVIAFQSDGQTVAKIMIAPVGELSKLQPRIVFIKECFAVAGLVADCEQAFTTADEALFHIDQAKPAVLILCATDKDYPDIVPPMCELIKERANSTIICLAGYPVDQVERFERVGIEAFLYQAVDLYSFLIKIGHRLGVLS